MVGRGFTCDTWAWYTDSRSGYCTNPSNNNYIRRFCRRACYNAGTPYPGDDCCPLSPPTQPPQSVSSQLPQFPPPLVSNQAPASPPCTPCDDRRVPYMISRGLQCSTWTWGLNNRCSASANWRSQRLCAWSCFEHGNGYAGDPCCPGGPHASALDISNSSSLGRSVYRGDERSRMMGTIVGLSIITIVLIALACFLRRHPIKGRPAIRRLPHHETAVLSGTVLVEPVGPPVVSAHTQQRGERLPAATLAMRDLQ